jgi:UDP-N-acetylmuramyl pentapeptide phosphotransferase/UDP-N-acetylglucosamine-1-phosphate transferase
VYSLQAQNMHNKTPSVCVCTHYKPKIRPMVLNTKPDTICCIHTQICMYTTSVFVSVCVCVCVGRGGVRISGHVLHTHIHHHLLGNGSQQKKVWLFFLSFVVIVVVMMIVCAFLVVAA